MKYIVYNVQDYRVLYNNDVRSVIIIIIIIIIIFIDLKIQTKDYHQYRTWQTQLRNLSTQYVRVDILITFGKHLHASTISLRGDA